MIGALILGILAGAIARLLIPGDALEQLEGWRSWLASIVLGLVGAFVGWLIFAGLLGIGDTDAFDLGGIIGAGIGSVTVLPAAGWALKRTHRRRRRSNSPHIGRLYDPAMVDTERYAASFAMLDKDGDGRVSAAEFKELMATIGVNYTDETAARAIAMMDKDGDGVVSPE